MYYLHLFTCKTLIIPRMFKTPVMDEFPKPVVRKEPKKVFQSSSTDCKLVLLVLQTPIQTVILDFRWYLSVCIHTSGLNGFNHIYIYI